MQSIYYQSKLLSSNLVPLATPLPEIEILIPLSKAPLSLSRMYPVAFGTRTKSLIDAFP